MRRLLGPGRTCEGLLVSTDTLSGHRICLCRYAALGCMREVLWHPHQLHQQEWTLAKALWASEQSLESMLGPGRACKDLPTSPGTMLGYSGIHVSRWSIVSDPGWHRRTARPLRSSGWCQAHVHDWRSWCIQFGAGTGKSTASHTRDTVIHTAERYKSRFLPPVSRSQCVARCHPHLAHAR